MQLPPDFSKCAVLESSRLYPKYPPKVGQLNRGIAIHSAASHWTHGATVQILLNNSLCYLDRKSCCKFLGISKGDNSKSADEIANLVFKAIWSPECETALSTKNPAKQGRETRFKSTPTFDLQREFLRTLFTGGKISINEIKNFFSSCSLVNKAWRDAIEDIKITLLNQGSIQFYHLFSKQKDQLKYLLSHASELLTLDLSCMHGLTDKEIRQIIEACPHIQTLKLPPELDITDATLIEIGKLQHLLHLRLSKNMSDASMTHLKTLTNLTSLDFSLCRNITDTGLVHLASLTNLTSLDFSLCGNITDTGLVHLASLTNLTSLDFSLCRNITDTGLVHLASLTNLTSLDLWDCAKITDAGLLNLAPLTNLTSLNLKNTDITNVGLDYLKTFKNLSSLVLFNCFNITHTGFIHLEGLLNLSSIDLSLCESMVTDAFLTKLKNFKNLSSLKIANCSKITDLGLSQLAALSNLIQLNLTYCEKITNAGLVYLKDLKKLSWLNLSFCKNLTGAGLVHLISLTNLSWLNLQYCPSITRASLTCLETPTKRLQVLWNEKKDLFGYTGTLYDKNF